MTWQPYVVAMVVAVIATLPARAWRPGDEVTCPTHDLYENGYYGFEVRIPRGLKGCPDSPVGMSDHGVEFRTAQGGLLDVFASFNALFHKNADEAGDFELQVIQDQAIAGSLEVLSRRHIKLGGLDAVRLIARYRRKTDGRAGFWDVSVALRGDKGCESSGSCPLEYAVALSSDEGSYSTDELVLEQVLTSWKPIRETAI